MMTLGKRLRKLRAEHGFSQETLAKMADIAPATISCIENGKNEMTIRTACALSDAMGISLDELVGREPGERYCL